MNRAVTWAASQGAAIVTTALASGICPAAASTAAPPRLWPIRIAGACRVAQRRPDEIGDIRGEVAIGEFAVAGAQAGEIEAQHRDAMRRQSGGNARRRKHVLAAGEAMSEQRAAEDRAAGRSSATGQTLTLGAGEVEAFGRHGGSSLVIRRLLLLILRSAERARLEG